MSRHNRRTFLKQAAAAGAGVALVTIAGTKSSGRVLGANDTVRVGVAGINGRGSEHIREFTGIKGVQVAYLIDPDSRLFAQKSKTVQSRGGNLPKCVQDIRKALDDKDLDAVSIAAPNHWHSLLAIWSCQAGKDVYVEKPVSHNLFEGRKCIEAAARYKRVVQHGTQQRSDEGRAAEIATLQAGKFGKLLVSKGYICKPRWSIGFAPNAEPPKELDFDIWLGPAPKQPFHTNIVHYKWHWFWDFGCGEIGNQGVHESDVARWAIKGSTLPTKVWSLGCRLGYKDQGQTPNMQLAVLQYGEAMIVLEVRGLVGLPPGAKLNSGESYGGAAASKTFLPKVANEFYTSEGVVRGGKLYPTGGGKSPKIALESVKLTPGGAFASFITCVRQRKPQAVNAPMIEAHYSTAVHHLANISYRLGTEVPFSQEPEGAGNPQVAESFETIKRNLKAVGVDLDKSTYRMGRTLTMDPKTEKFVGDEEANRYLTRQYRAPYVVPEQV